MANEAECHVTYLEPEETVPVNLLAPLRSTVRAALEAHKQYDRRATEAALRLLEALLSDCTAEPAPGKQPHDEMIRKLEDAFPDIREPSHRIERIYEP